MAPDIRDYLHNNLDKSNHNDPFKSDVFSLGLTFYQILSLDNIEGTFLILYVIINYRAESKEKGIEDKTD